MIIQKKMYPLLALVTLGVLVLVLSGCSRKINLTDYVDIETIGVDGRGIARTVIDEEKLARDIAKAGKLNPADEEEAKIIEDYVSRIKCEAAPQKDLKNGDLVALSTKFTNSNNDLIQIVEGEIQKKVENLPPGEKINIFDYVDYIFTGASPNAKLEVVNKGHDKFFESLRFEVSKEKGLANGDQVEVKAVYDAVLAAESLYYIEKDQETIEVEGMDQYVASASELKESLDAFRVEGQTAINLFTKNELMNGQGAYKTKLLKTVFTGAKKRETIEKGQSANVLALIYEIDKGDEILYAALYFNNIVTSREKGILTQDLKGNVAVWGKDQLEVEKYVLEDPKPLYHIEEIKM